MEYIYIYIYIYIYFYLFIYLFQKGSTYRYKEGKQLV